MKRRSFLGSIGLVFLTLKSWASQSGDSEASEVVVSPGKEFFLPANPKKGQKYRFSANKEWIANPGTIRRNGQLIMGESSDLMLDTEVSFTLIYSDSENGWVFV